MRDGYKVLSDLRWKLERWSHNDSMRALLTERLLLLSPLAYAPERHGPPPTEECENCLGTGYENGHEDDCHLCEGQGIIFVLRFCGVADCYQCTVWPLPSPRVVVRDAVEADVARVRQLSLFEAGEVDVPY